METNSKGKRMVFEEDIKYLQELKGDNISSKTVGRVVDTNNITTLSDEVCNALKCGDIVNKVDSTGKHSYRVSYKKDEGGMCLTYSDASCVETVSYDYTAGHWVYNSKDVTTIENMNKMEKIKDKSNHLRFIEGTGTTETITGVTFGYCKWSLSGTHLMIVLTMEAADTTAINYGNVATFDIPAWVGNKIFPVTGKIIERKGITLYASDLTTQTWTLNIQKESSTTLSIYARAALTLTAARSGRIQFDLLIDNE